MDTHRLVILTALAVAGVLSTPPLAGQLAPGNVTVTPTRSSATIAWSGVRTSIGYRVLRALDPKSRGQDLTPPLAPQVSSFIDGTVAPGTQYFYQVIAINKGGSEAASPVTPFTMPGAKPVIATGPLTAALPAASSPATIAKAGKQLPVLSNPTASRYPKMPIAGKPEITGFSQPKAYPNSTISILGTSLGSVTSVTYVPVVRNWGTWVPIPGNQPVVITATPVNAGRVDAGVPSGALVGNPPSRWSFGDQTSLLVVVAGSYGVDTSDVPLGIDKTPVITGVVKAKVQAGETIEVTGWNLESVNGAYIGQGTRGTAVNPKLTTSAWPNGNGAVVTTEPGCNREDYLFVETTYQLAPLVGSNFKVRCAIPPEVTAITPTAGPAGTVVQLQGKGFRNVAGVTGAPIPNITWSRTADPTQLDSRLLVTLPPPAAGYGGVMSLLLTLTTDMPYGSISNFPMNQSLTVLAPPQITGTTPGYGEPGMWIALQGSALSAPPQIVPKVRVNGVLATLNPGYSGTYLMFAIPSGATAGPITVETAGGIATVGTPVLFVNGPSQVTHLSPAAGQQGDAVTVHGTNLARAGGICTGTTGDWVYWLRVGGMASATSNSELNVVVPPLRQGTQSFPIHLLLPMNPSNPGQQQCDPTPTAVQFQRTP